MNTKPSFLLVLFYLALSSCTTKTDVERPYSKGLINLASGDSVLENIFYKNNYLNYENKKIRVYGYINKVESRIYDTSDFTDSMLEDESFKDLVSVKLYKNYKTKRLLDVNSCKANAHLIELHGTFHIQKAVGDSEDDSYYFTDITKIYDFDTRPKGIGTGEKYQCYPKVEKN